MFGFHGLSDKAEKWGLFGDYIGGALGVGVGLLTVLLVYRTFLLQKTELQQTRKNLEHATIAQMIAASFAAQGALLSAFVDEERMWRDIGNEEEANKARKEKEGLIKSLRAWLDDMGDPEKLFKNLKPQ